MWYKVFKPISISFAIVIVNQGAKGIVFAIFDITYNTPII